MGHTKAPVLRWRTRAKETYFPYFSMVGVGVHYRMAHCGTHTANKSEKGNGWPTRKGKGRKGKEMKRQGKAKEREREGKERKSKERKGKEKGGKSERTGKENDGTGEHDFFLRICSVHHPLPLGHLCQGVQDLSLSFYHVHYSFLMC